jgi:uncharacterized protein YggE
LSTRLVPVLALVLSVAALLAAAPSGAAQIVPVQPQVSTGISVVGSGIVLADPNVARITFGSEVFDASLSNAQAEASRRMDAVVTKLKADGIPDTDIRTTSFNINPQYDQRDQSQPAVLRGYTVQNQVEVKTTNVGGLGALIDDAVGVGATRVFGIRFEASNMEALKNQARDQAMQNARAKAEQLAKDSGITLGRPISIEESDTGGVTPVARQADSSLAAAPAAVSTPIQPGQLQVSTNVRVIFSIQ